ncbi:MAG: hypothetical protein VX835_02645 [Pseudomonadota bacterium]|nr:hypothetical protein [Pseudomonadota bacterium]
MIQYLSFVIRKLIFYTLSFFWGSNYFDINHLLKAIRQSLSEPSRKNKKSILKRCYLLGYLVGFEIIDPNHRLNDIFQELTLSLKRQPENNICYEQCLFLYDLLILIFPNNHRFILSVFNEYPVIGIKKNHEHLSFVFNTDVANHVNKLNALNIPINYLKYFIMYAKLLSHIKINQTSIENQSINRFNWLIQTHQNMVNTINQSVNQKWFKYLLRVRQYYEPLIDYLNLLHNKVILEEQANIKFKWIDPWSYLYNSEFQTNIDHYLYDIGMDINGMDYIVKQWHEKWFDETLQDKLDWQDIIIFDDKFDKIIYEKWPLIRLFKKMVIEIDAYEYHWCHFKQAFLDINLDLYQHKSLSFWDMKFKKIISLIHNDTYLISFKLKHGINWHQFNFKEVKWSINHSTLMINKDDTCDLTSSQMIQLCIVPEKIPLKSFGLSSWLFLIKQNKSSSYALCVARLSIFNENQINHIKAILPDQLKKQLSNLIVEYMSNNNWHISCYLWLKNEISHMTELNKILLNDTIKLSPNIKSLLSSVNEFKQIFKRHQVAIFNSWQRKNVDQFDDFILTLKPMIEQKIITYKPLIKFIENKMTTVLTKKALHDLNRVGCIESLNQWFNVYYEKKAFMDLLSSSLNDKVIMLLKDSRQKEKLFNNHFLDKKMFCYINDVDLFFIRLLWIERKKIDQWCLTAHTFLLNELSIAFKPFEINPLLFWLHAKKILSFRQEDIRLIQKIYSLNKIIHQSTVTSFKQLLFNLENNIFNQINQFNSLTLIKVKEEKYEYRAVQKKCFSSLRTLSAGNKI